MHHRLLRNDSREVAAILKHQKTGSHALMCEWCHVAGTVETKIASVSTFILGPEMLRCPQCKWRDKRALPLCLCGVPPSPVSHHPGPRTAKGPWHSSTITAWGLVRNADPQAPNTYWPRISGAGSQQSTALQRILVLTQVWKPQL